MKKSSGHIPEPYEDEEEAELRNSRRYYRSKPVRKKARRALKPQVSAKSAI
jgi:hypothetical protein